MKRVGQDGYTPCRRVAQKPLGLAPEASVNLKKWVPWDAFCALPPTLQKLYAQTQADEYRVGIGIFAMAWGKSDPTVRAVFMRLGVRVPPGTCKADKQRFMEFVNGADGESPSSVSYADSFPEGEAIGAREGKGKR